MSEAPVEIPTSRWERIVADKRRLAALALAALVIFALTGVAVAWLLPGVGANTPRSVADLQLAPLSAGPSQKTPGVPATGTARPADAPGDAPSGSGQPLPGGTADPGRPLIDTRRMPYVAFRLDGSIVVAREDGTAPLTIATSATGDFALSPDGSLLALVDEGELSITSVADRDRRVIGPAQPYGLAWHPDSELLYFTRISAEEPGYPEVWRVSAAGGTPEKALRGGPPAVASDGTVAAPPAPILLGDPADYVLMVLPQGGAAREVRIRGQAVECAAEAGLIAYAVHGMDFTDDTGVMIRIEPEIWLMRTDGSEKRRLIGPPASSRPSGYGRLILSPDGSQLLFAEVGDDGYSRAYTVPTAQRGQARPLTVRRDTYPVGWSADGSRVLFVEGNAFQGEPTSLVKALPDGSGREVIAQGAGL